MSMMIELKTPVGSDMSDFENEISGLIEALRDTHDKICAGEDVSYLGDEKISMVKSLDFDNLSIRPVRRRSDGKLFVMFE